jgi:DNA repair protein RecO (recombination protein O)
MNNAIVHGLVLKRINYGENDRKITVLSQEEGVVDFLAKGARKPSSRLSGSTEPLSVSIFESAKGRVHRFITQTQPISSFPGIRADYDRLSYALAIAELASAVLPHGKQAEDEFSLMVKTMKMFEVHEKPLVVFVWAQIQLMSAAGNLPAFGECVATGELVKEAKPWLSPHAGGYIRPEHAMEYTDRFQTTAEILICLKALTTRDIPPPHLKFAKECAQTLYPFWREFIGKPIPALETAVLELHD